MNFRAFLEEHNPLHIAAPVGGNTVGTHNDMATAIFQQSTATGSENLGNMGYGLPGIDISATSVPKRCRILDVLNGPIYVYHDKRRRNDLSNRSPVKIIFDDGTSIEMPVARFEDLWNSGTRLRPPRRGEPGLMVQVTFQRNPADQSPTASKVDSIRLL